MRKLPSALLLFVSILLITNSCKAQHAVHFNLDIPFQYEVGYNYFLNEKIDIEAGIGLVVPPFNKWLFSVLPIPSDKNDNREFARESADWGYVANLGGNYQINENWYAGLFGQYAVLKGSSSVKEVYESSFKKDVEDVLVENNIQSQFVPIVIDQSKDKAEFESVIYQLGLQFGRTFQLNNPNLLLRTSIALSRTIYPETTLTSFTYEELVLPPLPGLPVLDTDEVYTEIEKELGTILEDDTDEVFRDYGYITTLRIGLIYKLGGNK